MKQSVQKVRVVSNLKAMSLFNLIVKSVTFSLFCSFLLSSLLGTSDVVMHTPCNLKGKFTSRTVTNSVAEADVSAVKSPATLFSIVSGAYKRIQPSWLQEPWKDFRAMWEGMYPRQSKDRDLALCFISCTRYQLHSLKAVCAHGTLPPVL